MISRGLWGNGKFSEATSQLDRFDDEEGKVAFPALLPRRFANDIFGSDHDPDSRRMYESFDKKSLLYYCWAGRTILIATLKPSSQFNKVQDALAAIEFDPTSAEDKLKMMAAQVKALHQLVADQQKRIEVLEGKV